MQHGKSNPSCAILSLMSQSYAQVYQNMFEQLMERSTQWQFRGPGNHCIHFQTIHYETLCLSSTHINIPGRINRLRN